MIQFGGKYADVKIFTENIENEALSQLFQIANHPAFTNPIRVMPDVHAGKGSVVGFTMPATDKIVPNVIGYDIGCGVESIFFQCKESDAAKLLTDKNLLEFDKLARERIPTGQDVHDSVVGEVHMRYFLSNIMLLKKDLVNKATLLFKKIFKDSDLLADYNVGRYFTKGYIENEMQSKIGIDSNRLFNSIGTLGGGNHFIEIGISEADEKGDVLIGITVHTGSRNLGKKVCEYWQKKAVKDCGKKEYSDEIQKLKAIYSGEKLGEEIKKLKERYSLKVSKELAYLSSVDDVAGYLLDMCIAQVYATINRRVILDILYGTFCDTFGKDCFKLVDHITSVHNYIDFEDGIIRKGSIKAYEGQKVIIPLNMRDGTIIGTVKESNKDWNYSLPHGAGRVLSRSKAKELLDVNEFKDAMKGIVATNINESTLDEAPFVYKDKSEIINNISQHFKEYKIIKPVLNIK